MNTALEIASAEVLTLDDLMASFHMQFAFTEIPNLLVAMTLFPY